MVFIDTGLNKIRDLVDDSLTNGLLGTGTVAESVSDTGLLFPVGTTLGTVTSVPTNKLLTVSYGLTSAVAVGTVFAEFGLLYSGTASFFNRQTFFPITHSDNEEWTFDTTIFFNQQ